jgi:hypothetical protein
MITLNVPEKYAPIIEAEAKARGLTVEVVADATEHNDRRERLRFDTSMGAAG